MHSSIVQYDDYRIFLQDYFQWRKARNPRWSYTTFARALGLAGGTSIHKIMQGRRDPSQSLTHKMASYFKFSAAERDHFVKLAFTHRVGKRAASAALLRDAETGETRALTTSEFTAISAWWFYAIRQMSGWKAFRPSPTWIQKQLLYPARLFDIRRGLVVMNRLGLLSERNGLTYAASTQGSALVRRFHMQMIEHALEAVSAMAPSERLLNSLTVSMRQEDEAEGRAAIEAFARWFNDKFGNVEGDRVFQLNVQFFPLAKSSSSDPKGDLHEDA